MRIVLINEACGVMRNLRDGLRELGHEVLGVSTYSNVESNKLFDYDLSYHGTDLFSQIARCIAPLSKLKKLQSYDVIQFIYQASAIPSWPTRYLDLAKLKLGGARLGYYGLGCDEVSLIRANPDSGERLPCNTCVAFDEIGKGCEKNILSFRSRASRYSHLFDYCISSSVDYKHCHSFFPKAKHARIPLPVNVTDIPFNPAQSSGRTKIIHAPTRRGFKGSNVIIEAIELLKHKRDDFEFKIVEGLPYSEYIKVLSECDVYIDQVNSHGVGMAALENMAMGKIVFSGNSQQYKEWMPFANNSPVIHTSNAADQLAMSIDTLLEDRSCFNELALKGRAYVAENHGHINIARQFVSHWSGSN